MNIVRKAPNGRLLMAATVGSLVLMLSASPVSAARTTPGPWPSNVNAVGQVLCMPFGATKVRIDYLDQHPEANVIVTTYSVVLQNFPDGPVTASAHVACRAAMGTKEFDQRVTIGRTVPGFAGISPLNG
jgi:hypothetical protein